MTRMARLADTLGDLDDILDQADEQTVTESLERGEAPDHGLAEDPDCTWCGHGFHGLRCYRPPQYTGTLSFGEDIDDWALTVTDPDVPWPCRCDSALTRLDDTWRPLDSTGTQRHMDQTGMDGWAAHADLTAVLMVTIHIDVSPFLAAFATASRQFDDALRASRWVFTVPPGAGPTFVAVDDLNDPPLADWERALVEPDEPLTPQARALQLRQTRNTGPERPPAGRARRPRRHGG